MVEHMRQEETGHSGIVWDAAPLSSKPGMLPPNEFTESSVTVENLKIRTIETMVHNHIIILYLTKETFVQKSSTSDETMRMELMQQPEDESDLPMETGSNEVDSHTSVHSPKPIHEPNSFFVNNSMQVVQTHMEFVSDTWGLLVLV